MRWFTLSLLLCLLLVPARGHVASALGGLNVQLSDLPTGSALDREMDETGAQLAADNHRPAATARQMGIIRANERLFQLPRSIQLFCQVTLMSSVSKAHAIYSHERTLLTPGDTIVPANSLGDERIVANGYDASQKPPVTVTAMHFRRGRYWVYMEVSPTVRSFFATPQAIAIARLVDARIQHAR